MISHGELDPDDVAFERRLLQAGRDDGPSEADTQRAWETLAASAGFVAVATGASVGPAALARAVRNASMKWLAVGAVGGSVLTAAWLEARSDAARTRFAPQAVEVAPPREPKGEPAAAPPAPNAPALVIAGEASPPVAAEPARHAAPKRGARAAASAEPPPGSTSTLAREIALLDAVGAAVESANFDRALSLVEQYEREFPEGQLARDADALAIEALRLRGDRAEAARRAERFLVRHSKDPHAARVKTAVER